MKDRILLLIKTKNYTAAQFADEIGVQKSGVSHVLSGRNNPSLDFVQKILGRFPELSTDWLLFGRGPMMLNDIPASFAMPPIAIQTNTVHKLADLFSQDLNPLQQPDPSLINDIKESGIESNKQPESMTGIADDRARNQQKVIKDIPESPKASTLRQLEKRSIQKIIVLYDDKTFVEYLPES